MIKQLPAVLATLVVALLLLLPPVMGQTVLVKPYIQPGNGALLLDELFDGEKDTTPVGTIHIVTGGGGAKLYSVNLEKTIEALKKEHGVNYVPLTAKYEAGKHSFSVVEVTTTTLEWRQIAIDGTELDRFRITK